MSIQSLDLLVDKLQSEGKYSFTKEQAVKELDCKDDSFYKSAQRLTKKSRILKVIAGFYIIIPAEYLKIGTLPPTWFIRELMEYMGVNFYVGLLSAASMQGATHHAVQVFQVVTEKQVKPIVLKGHKISFHKKTKFSLENCLSLDFPTGKCRISGPALTAVDLIKNYKSCGYMDLIATVLSELLEEIKDSDLLSVLEKNDVDVITVKRLGYLMDLLGYSEKSALLHQWLQQFKPSMNLLINEKGRYGFERNKKWGLIINEEIEPDI